MQVLRRDNGKAKIFSLLTKCIHNNSLQVINQYAISTEEGAAHDNRYDVTVLVNGLPLIHTELFFGAFPFGEAFNQIDRYQRDSFLWASSRALRVCADFRDLQRHKYEVLFQYHPFQPYQGCQSAESQEVRETSNSFEFLLRSGQMRTTALSPILLDFTRPFSASTTF